jgi:hypothetical protein
MAVITGVHFLTFQLWDRGFKSRSEHVCMSAFLYGVLTCANKYQKIYFESQHAQKIHL